MPLPLPPGLGIYGALTDPRTRAAGRMELLSGIRGGQQRPGGLDIQGALRAGFTAPDELEQDELEQDEADIGIGHRNYGGGVGGIDSLLLDLGRNMMPLDDESLSPEDKGLALAQMGFGIAAGQSPHAISNIGAGAAYGIESLQRMRQQRALRRMEEARLLETTAYRQEMIDSRMSPVARLQKDRAALLAAGAGRNDPRVLEINAAITKATHVGDGTDDAKALEIKRLKDVYGYDDKQATALAYDLVGFSRDQFTGELTPFDKRQLFNDARQGASSRTDGGIKAPPPEPLAPVLGDVSAYGVRGKLPETLQKATFGVFAPKEGLVEQRQKYKMLRELALDAFARSGRPSNYAQQRVEELLPSSGYFESPVGAYDQLSTLYKIVERDLYNDMQTIADSSVSMELRKESEAKIRQERQLLSAIGDPSKFERPKPEDWMSLKGAVTNDIGAAAGVNTGDVMPERPASAPESVKWSPQYKGWFMPDPNNPRKFLQWFPN